MVIYQAKVFNEMVIEDRVIEYKVITKIIYINKK